MGPTAPKTRICCLDLDTFFVSVEQRAFVEPLPCRKWPGIGPVAEARLRACGILTLGELLSVPESSREGPLAASVCQVVADRLRSLCERDC